MGAIETLLVWKDLEVNRYEMQNKTTGEIMVWNLTREEEERKSCLEFEVIKREPFLEWIYENHHRFGCNLELVSDRSGAGRQFVQGFGGVGGMLRWKVQFTDDHLGDKETDAADNIDDTSSENGRATEYDFDDGAFGF